jgi:hypothetical protein
MTVANNLQFLTDEPRDLEAPRQESGELMSKKENRYLAVHSIIDWRVNQAMGRRWKGAPAVQRIRRKAGGRVDEFVLKSELLSNRKGSIGRAKRMRAIVAAFLDGRNVSATATDSEGLHQVMGDLATMEPSDIFGEFWQSFDVDLDIAPPGLFRHAGCDGTAPGREDAISFDK